MLTPQLHDAARAFGRSLRDAPAIAAYRAASDALEADPVAQAALSAVQAQAEAVAAMQRRGEAPSREALDELGARQAVVRNNLTVMAYLRATNDAKRFLPGAARHLSTSLGIDFAALVAPGC